MKRTIQAGIDNLITVKDELAGCHVGLVTGPSGVDRNLKPTAEIIAENFQLTALFGPEHGIRGSAQAGESTGSFRDRELGVQVYSLYGERKAPTREMLDRLDVMMFDMQDVGSRYYTYMWTLCEVMQSCADADVPLYVFDRPNPIGLERIEGNMLDEEYSSFVGKYSIPARYGLTIGEFAGYINDVKHIGCNLTVIPCEGLDRSMMYEDMDIPFVAPSPNIPTPEAALNYVGTCLFEGTNLSEGRGTTLPFSLIGAPWLRSEVLCRQLNTYGFEGVLFRKAYFTPTFSKYAGEVCEGIQLHITDPRRYQPFEVAMRIIDEIRMSFHDFKWNEHHIDRLFGDNKFRTEYIGRDRIDAFLSMNEERLEVFRQSIRSYYIY